MHALSRRRRTPHRRQAAGADPTGHKDRLLRPRRRRHRARAGGRVALLGKQSALFFPTGTMAQQATHPRARRSALAPDRRHSIPRATWRPTRSAAISVCTGSSACRSARATNHSPSRASSRCTSRLPRCSSSYRSGRSAAPSPPGAISSRQVDWARDRGAAVHLDGARLWDVSPYYKAKHRKSIADIAALFDTVYVSFYKGLGGIAGCCVAGDTDLSSRSCRCGARATAAVPSACGRTPPRHSTALRMRLPRMPAYYRHALAIAAAVRDIPGRRGAPRTRCRAR